MWVPATQAERSDAVLRTAVRERDNSLKSHPGLGREFPEIWESLDQPAAQIGDPAGKERDSGNDQQPAHDLFDSSEMRAKPRQKGCERLNGQSRRDEGNAETKRIDRQQAGAFANASLRSCNRQDRAQDRPDAWRPAKSERQTH